MRLATIVSVVLMTEYGFALSGDASGKQATP